MQAGEVETTSIDCVQLLGTITGNVMAGGWPVSGVSVRVRAADGE